jgi:hypothetical protein
MRRFAVLYYRRHRRYGARRSRWIRGIQSQRKKTDEFKAGKETSTADLVGADSRLNDRRTLANFIAGIRKGENLNAPVSVGNVAVTMLQLSNIAWFQHRELNLNPTDGKIENDPEAMKFWNREYEKGWEPRI